MSRIIVDNQSSLSDAKAFEAIIKILKDGRVSENGKSYCYHTVFYISQNEELHVTIRRNKISDTFMVYTKELK